MTNYLLNFTVYTLAMIGLIFFALFLYKKCAGLGVGVRKNSHLKVIDILNVSPRKAFYIIGAGKEKFLIASDTERMNLISKLESNTFLEEE